jgi:hypothetical protein
MKYGAATAVAVHRNMSRRVSDPLVFIMRMLPSFEDGLSVRASPGRAAYTLISNGQSQNAFPRFLA